MSPNNADLLKLFLPDFILDNFDFNGAITQDDTFHINLEEINNPPAE